MYLFATIVFGIITFGVIGINLPDMIEDLKRWKEQIEERKRRKNKWKK